MKKLSLCKTIFAIAFVLTSYAANADLTMKMTVLTIENVIPGKPLSSHDSAIAKDLLADSGSYQGTIFSSGQKTKTIIGNIVAITDTSSNTSIILEPDDKTWYVQQVPSAIASAKINHIVTTNVVDMKQTKTILGHEAHLYKYYQKGSAITSVGYVWATPDIPSSTNPIAVGLMHGVTRQIQITGTALKVSTVDYLRRYNLRTSTVYEASAVSAAPIPASVFTVPSNYTKISNLNPSIKESSSSKRTWVPGHWAYD